MRANPLKFLSNSPVHTSKQKSCPVLDNAMWNVDFCLVTLLDICFNTTIRQVDPCESPEFSLPIFSLEIWSENSFNLGTKSCTYFVEEFDDK